MASAIFNALKYIPASVGIKALEKYNPKFKNYFAKVAAYGLDTNRALDYLADRFGGEGEQNYKQQLEQGERQGTLRPDELASKSNIANSEIPGRIARTGAALGGGLIGASAAMGSELLEREEQEKSEQQKQYLQQQAQQQAHEQQFQQRQSQAQQHQKNLQQKYEQQQGQQGQKERKSSLMQKEEERFEKAKEESYFEKAFKALQRGKNIVEGKEDHILSEARPFFDRGDIKSPDDLKKFYNSYYRTRVNSSGQGPSNQGIDPKLMSAMDAIRQSMERLRARRGG